MLVEDLDLANTLDGLPSGTIDINNIFFEYLF